jgi:hypothetical protein
MHKCIVHQATTRSYRSRRGSHNLPHMALPYASHVTLVTPASIPFPYHSRDSNITMSLSSFTLNRTTARSCDLSYPKYRPITYSSYVASNDALVLSMRRFIRSYTYRHISAASNDTGLQCKLFLSRGMREAGSRASP